MGVCYGQTGKCNLGLLIAGGISMAIATFNTVNDGLKPNQKERGHYVVDVNLEDSGPWIPYAEAVWVQLCRFNVTTGGFTVVLKGLPGAKLGVHYHTGTVHGFTLRGRWRYLEHDWIAKPGTFIFEPAGEAHTLVITDDSPEPAIIFFVVDGALVYLDKPVNGTMAAFEDGFSALELSRKFFRETGLDVAQLDLRIR
jgi:2,4'-dihydroxyacetophenone dioxygenase